MILYKNVLFVGNRERLHKYVQRENGKMLKQQRFVVTLKSNKVKRYAAIPFCFYCRYQKSENGYDIQYFPCISSLGFIRFFACLAGLGYVFHRRSGNWYIPLCLLLLLCFVNYFIQRFHCVRQFEAACHKTIGI